MRNVESHLLGDKMDEAVTHYINSHQSNEPVHVDANTLSLNVQDDGRVVTVMHPQNFSTQVCRQVSLGEQIGDGPWVEELLDGRLAALVAHLAQPTRTSHHQAHHKMSSVRSDVDSSVILDTPMRMFNGHSHMEQPHDTIVIEVPSLPGLPPLQDMKRCPDSSWYSKDKSGLKESSTILTEEDSQVLVMATSSPLQNKQHNKKSLPHKKRISRKLKRNAGSSTPTQEVHDQNDIVVIHCPDEQQEEILPDSFVDSLRRHTVSEQIPEPSSHVAHEMRPILICQLCGEFYGEEQLKFYQHLKQHYEPQASIIMENPIVPDITIDKMSNTCIVDNVATLPDSIVELSLENTVPKTIYQSMDNIPIHKHILYSPSEKTLYNGNKAQYCLAGMEKEVPTDMDDTLDKLELYCCVKCNKSFRKQKQCETHIKEVHSNSKLEDMAEFSEPEDLMEGIHVAVEDAEQEHQSQYESVLLPHLTVENGQVHQQHVRHWYSRSGADSPGGAETMCACGGYCGVCTEHAPHLQPQSVPPHPALHPHLHPSHASTQLHHAHSQPPPDDSSQLPPPPPPPAPPPAAPLHAHPAPPTPHASPPPPPPSPPRSPLRAKNEHVMVTRDDVLQRILELQSAEPGKGKEKGAGGGKGQGEGKQKPKSGRAEKRFECAECGLVFRHRNSLMYHMHKHRERQQECRHCEKRFYTATALKIHLRMHEGSKPCACTECGQHFRQSSDLKYHIASKHSTTKDFKCEYCNKEFARRYSLNLHRRIHTGEKNYPCEMCGKSFRASSYRLVHMRIHTGAKPFKCPHCEKSFRVAYDMRRHVRVVHEKNKMLQIKQESEHAKEKKEKPVKKNKKAPNVTVHDAGRGFDTELFKFKFREVCPDVERAGLREKRARGAETEARAPGAYRENTDGKMPIFSHVEKPGYNGSIVSNLVTISDIKNMEISREKDAECENGFFDKLSFYNISAV